MGHMDQYTLHANELKNLFHSIDAAVLQMCSQYADEVHCKKGCSDCCNAVFDVSYIEALTIYDTFRTLGRKDRRAVTNMARKAVIAWERLVERRADLSMARIRCPLLTETGECACYAVRPVNCRTYGLPTVIAGKAHVCGLSGFIKGVTYTTVNLNSIQEKLLTLSMGLGGLELGRQRWPIAAVLLQDSSKNRPFVR